MSEEVRRRRLRVARGCAAGAMTWSIGVLLVALLVPAYNGETTTGANGLTLTAATFVQDNGAWVLAPLAIPLIAAAVVLAALRTPGPPRWAWLAVLLVLALAVITILTIGAILLPVAVLMAIALRLAGETPHLSRRRSPPSPPAVEEPASGPEAGR